MKWTDRLRAPTVRLREGWLPVVEATLAATVAWFVAFRLVGHPAPFFAPAAALIVLGQARGQRIRRALEVVLGVAAGVLVAELVIRALGPRTTLTVFTVLLLTIGLAVAVGAGTVSVVQAAVSALYLVVVPSPMQTWVPDRFVDALIGGGVALAASQLVDVRTPLAPLVAQARRTFGELAALLEEVAAALAAGDEPAARVALVHARGMDALVDGLRTAVDAAGEALRWSPRRRQHRGRLRAVDETVRQVDFLLRNSRVLARAAVSVVRLGTTTPPGLAGALTRLAEAVGAAGAALAADLGDQPAEAARCTRQAEAAALDAVRLATSLLGPGSGLSLVMIVGGVRFTAIDLLRGLGGDDVAVLALVDEATGLPPV